MSFRSLSLVAVAASILSTGAWAQAAQQGQAAKAPPTRAGLTQTIDARFAELDANKDGSLVAAEISAAQSRALQQAASMMQQRAEAEFKRLDTNKDNQLSMTEFKAMASAPRAAGTAAEMIAQIDANKDGKISAAEYRAPPLADFDRVDANKDGTVTEQEAQVLSQR